MVEKIIRDCAHEFARELAKYATKLDVSTWDRPVLSLRVKFNKEKGPTLSLNFSGDGVDVTHTTLGILMDEVYRRKGYDEKAQLSMQHESASLRSLTHQQTPEEQEQQSEQELEDLFNQDAEDRARGL